MNNPLLPLNVARQQKQQQQLLLQRHGRFFRWEEQTLPHVPFEVVPFEVHFSFRFKNFGGYIFLIQAGTTV